MTRNAAVTPMWQASRAHPKNDHLILQHTRRMHETRGAQENMDIVSSPVVSTDSLRLLS